jgi:hypothetical protein
LALFPHYRYRGGRSRLADLTTRSNPASAIFLMTTSTIDAGLVKQSLPDIFPDGMWSIEPDRIGLLNFDDAKAAHALDAQRVVRDFERQYCWIGSCDRPAA